MSSPLSTAEVQIIRPGLQTTIQDFGRAGLRHQGVPASGAADPRAMIRANRCVGVEDGAAVLEFTLNGPTLRLTADTGFAVAGAPCDVKLNGRVVSAFKGHLAKAGSLIEIGRITAGARGYIAFDRAIAAREFGGSKSTHIYSGLGGHKGRALEKHDRIKLGPRGGTGLSHEDSLRITDAQILRIVPGPEFRWLTEKTKTRLTRLPFTAGTQTDRMGTRLIGKTLRLKSKTPEMVSSALLPGTLQLPAGGQIVLSLVDSHCTGGYVRAARIIRRDLPLTGQIKPGSPIWFRWATEDDA